MGNERYTEKEIQRLESNPQVKSVSIINVSKLQSVLLSLMTEAFETFGGVTNMIVRT